MLMDMHGGHLGWPWACTEVIWNDHGHEWRSSGMAIDMHGGHLDDHGHAGRSSGMTMDMNGGGHLGCPTIHIVILSCSSDRYCIVYWRRVPHPFPVRLTSVDPQRDGVSASVPPWPPLVTINTAVFSAVFPLPSSWPCPVVDRWWWWR